MQKSIIVLRTCVKLTVLLLLPASVIAQTVWQQTNGPYGGSVRSIVSSASGDILVGTLNGGGSRSTGIGASWIQTGLTNTGAQALANGMNGLFAGTDDGVFRSTDNGSSWEPINNGLTSQFVQALLASPGPGFESFQLVANAVGVIDPPLSAAFAFQSFPTPGGANPSSAGQASGQPWAFHAGGGTGSYSSFLSRALRNDNFDRVVPFDWEMRFTSAGSWTVFRFSTGTLQKVPFELWNTGINTPNDTSDDYRLIPWMLEASAIGLLEPDTTYGLPPNDHPGSGGLNDPYTQWIYWQIPEEHLDNSPGTTGYDNYITQIDTSDVTGSGTYLFDGAEAMARTVLVCSNCDDVSGGTLDPGVERVPEQGTVLRFISTKANNIMDIFAGTSTGGVFRSSDDGDNWTQINTGLTNTNVRTLAANSSVDIFARTAGGVFRSTDNGDNWTQINTGLTNTDVQAVAVNDSDDVFVGTIGGGVFRSTDNGDNWTQINTGLTNTVVQALAINQNDDIFAGGGDSNTLFRSTDNGQTWTAINNGLNLNGVQALAINASDDLFAGTPGSGVYLSTNNGDNWTQTGLTNTDVKAFAINTSGHIFAGNQFNNDGVFRSTDNGATWTQINTGLTDTDVQALAIKSNDDIFAGTLNGGVFRSTDNGNNWTQINAGFANTNINTLAIDSSGDIYAGTNVGGGAYRSTDNGNNWTQINAALTNTTVFALAVNKSDSLFAGTFGAGVFKGGEFMVSTMNFDINNIRMFVQPDGTFARDPVTGGAGFEWPITSGKYAIFSAGIWIGARVMSEVRTARVSYQSEFAPGPIINGVAADPFDPTYRVYKINEGDNAANNPDFASWPVSLGAPANPDGTPRLLGKQTLFSVYNDFDPSRHTTGTNPLGAEVQQTIFGSDDPDARNDAVFMRFEVVNRSTDTWDDAYITVWSDPDLGSFSDDLSGVDVGRQLAYTYNATDFDPVYGTAPPAIGFDFLKGSSFLNPSNAAIIHGSGSPFPDVNTGVQIYNYMQGLDDTGMPIQDPVTGLDTTYVYNGDPVTATGWVDPTLGDKRMMFTTGPFFLEPGQSKDILVVIAIARGTSNINSITELRAASDELQMLYDNGSITGGAIQNIATQNIAPDSTEVLDDISNSGAQLTLTAGSSGATVEVASYGSAPPGINELTSGSISGVGNYAEIQVTGTITWPVDIKVYYTADDLDSAGVSESELAGLYYWSTANNVWRLYSNSGADDQGRGPSTTSVDTQNVNIGGTDYEGFVQATAFHLTPMRIGAGASSGLVHFIPVAPTGDPRPVIIQNGTIDGVPIVGGDEIGVFDDTLCVGAGSFSGINPLTITIWMEVSLPGGGVLPGAKAGNPMSFKIWQGITNTDLAAQPGYTTGAGTFGEALTVVDTLSAISMVTQNIPIQAGQINLISFNMLPPDLAVENVFDDLDSLLVVQDDQGLFYIPPFSVNTIGNIDITNGYQVFITGAGDDNAVNVGTRLVPEDYSQSLNNTQLFMIVYPYQLPHPVENVFASITSSVDVVQDDLGKFWIPAFGINTIGNMQPGKGYQIFVNQVVNFTYPAASTLPLSKTKAIPAAPLSAPKYFDYQHTGLPYGVLVTGSEQGLKSGDEIAVFDGDLCVGAAVFSGEYPLVIPAWEGQDDYGLAGFKTGNEIGLRVWKSSEQLEMNAVVSFANSDESTFHGGPISLLSISSLVVLESIPLTFALDQNYPNPFNPATTIRYHLPVASEVTLTVYNLRGQLIRKLESGDRKAGSHQVVWDSRNDNGRQVASGVYFYRLRAGDFTDVKKFVLIK